jgi:hypothetical protein
MNNQAGKGGTVRIDLKEKTICISKGVLRHIGSPKHIQFFVNRKTSAMFIRGCDVKVEHSIAVEPRVYFDEGFRFRMKRTAFVEAINALCEWGSGGAYQLCGTSYTDRVIRFSFKDAKRLDCNAADRQRLARA